MGKFASWRLLGGVAMLFIVGSMTGCSEEPSLVPPPEPDKVQELRGDQATTPEPQSAESTSEEPAE